MLMRVMRVRVAGLGRKRLEPADCRLQLYLLLLLLCNKIAFKDLKLDRTIFKKKKETFFSNICFNLKKYRKLYRIQCVIHVQISIES